MKSWGLSIDRVSELNPQICIVLDEVEKPGNLGAIIRTAEAFGINTIFLSDSSLDYFNPNVVRSSRGLMGAINVAMGTKDEVYSFLESNNFSILGTSRSSSTSYFDFKYKSKTAFFIWK